VLVVSRGGPPGSAWPRVRARRRWLGDCPASRPMPREVLYPGMW